MGRLDSGYSRERLKNQLRWSHAGQEITGLRGVFEEVKSKMLKDGVDELWNLWLRLRTDEFD